MQGCVCSGQPCLHTSRFHIPGFLEVHGSNNSIHAKLALLEVGPADVVRIPDDVLLRLFVDVLFQSFADAHCHDAHYSACEGV